MVVAQSLGRMLDEFDPSGGIDLEKWNEAIQKNGGLMIQEAEDAGLYKGAVLSGTLGGRRPASSTTTRSTVRRCFRG